MRPSTSSAVAVAAVVLASTSLVAGQDQSNNLTPDGYWHNRYHALLSMAAYGDYNQTCPTQTFTEESKLRNFYNSTRPPWTVINTFGPTPSGCQGFTAIVPEMNKALIVFKGSYELEPTLPTDVVSWAALNMSTACPSCTVNRFALQGYLECKNETNDWQAIRDAYYGQDLVFSITGHGLGGMHSLIASVDLNHQNIDYYSHNYGTPRTFNQAGARHYNYYFNGEAGERGIAGNDMYTEFIPASDNYTHAGTAFYYSGLNKTASGMNWYICWGDNNQGDYTTPIVDDPACYPQAQPGSTAEQDHYFYFSNVGQCGGQFTQNNTIIDSYIAGAPKYDEIQASLASQSSLSSISSVSVASVLSVSSAAASISSVEASLSSASSASSASAAALLATQTATATGSASSSTQTKSGSAAGGHKGDWGVAGALLAATLALLA